MTHRGRPTWYPVLALLTVALAGPALFAQPDRVSVAPPPNWVRTLDWRAVPRPGESGKSEGARCLLYERQEHPRLREKFTRVALLMENETGVQDSGSLTLEFHPSFQELILHRVQIHRDGRTLDRLDRSKLKLIQPERELAGHIFTGEQSVPLFVEDLRVGDALEYAYTVRGTNPVLGEHYATRFVVQSGFRVDRLRVRVVWSFARPLHRRQHRTDVVPKEGRWEEGTEYVWDIADIEAIPAEDFVPSSHEPYPYLELSDFEGWSRVVDWALPLYTVADPLPRDLEELIASWRTTGASTEERARAALQFVQDEVRYTGIELGPESYRPAAPAETFQLRYGDCKGKALLLCAVLRQMHVEAYPALVSTSERDAVRRRLPSPFAFNHVIVKLVLEGKTIWLDPTRSHQGGLLWDRYVPPLGVALVIRPGAVAFETIPPPGSTQVMRRVTSTFRMEDYESPVALRIETTFHGSESDSAREYFARTDAKDVGQGYLNFYSRYYPGIGQPQPLAIADDRERNVLRVTEQYQIEDLWESETGRPAQAVLYADAMEDLLTNPESRRRTQPLYIPYPSRREQELVVHLPQDGWNIPAMEESVEHGAFAFRYRRSHSGSIVRFRYECETRAPEVSAAEVAEYLHKREAMENLLGDTLSRPDDRPEAILARVNWSMAVIAGFGLAVALAAGIWVWRAVPARDPVPVTPLPMPVGESQRQGLRGWLVLVGLGLGFGFITRFAILVQNWGGYFLLESWEAVAIPSAELYHPLYGPLLIFELLGNILLIAMNGLAMLLYFARRRLFPGVFIALLVTNAVVLLVDEVVGNAIPAVASEPPRPLAGAVIGAIVWVTYTLNSRRVKATFVR